MIMKKLLSTTALVLCMSLSGIAHAENEHGKPPYEAALSKLPAEKAAAFRAILKEAHDKDSTEKREAGMALHKQLDALLTAPTFDKEAYIAKSKELQSVWAEKHASMSEAFATGAATLSQAERKTLVEGMQKMHKRRWEHGNRDDKPE